MAGVCNGARTRLAYQRLLEAMVWLFENSIEDTSEEARDKALSLAALCIGGMVLARTLPDSSLAKEVQHAALVAAKGMVS